MVWKPCGYLWLGVDFCRPGLIGPSPGTLSTTVCALYHNCVNETVHACTRRACVPAHGVRVCLHTPCCACGPMYPILGLALACLFLGEVIVVSSPKHTFSCPGAHFRKQTFAVSPGHVCGYPRACCKLLWSSRDCLRARLGLSTTCLCLLGSTLVVARFWSESALEVAEQKARMLVVA